MSDWNLQEAPVALTKWRRSWRQEFFTDLGSDFRFVAHLEDAVSDGAEATTEHVGVVTRSASQVMEDPRVQQLSAIMTELVKEWMDEDEAARLAQEAAAKAADGGANA